MHGETVKITLHYTYRHYRHMECCAKENKYDVSGNKLILNLSNFSVIENKKTWMAFFAYFVQNGIINSMEYGCYFIDNQSTNSPSLKEVGN